MANNLSNNLAVVILAAGQGKRLGSPIPKVVAKTTENPLIIHVLSTVAYLPTQEIIIVTGFKREVVEEVIADNLEKNSSLSCLKNKVKFAYQEKQLGTGDAVKSALPFLENFKGDVLILYGDVPLISKKTIEDFISHHHNSKSTISLISFNEEKPNQYGRIIRDSKKEQIEKIVEFKDCSEEELKISEVNSGIYLVESSFLKPSLNELKNNNSQQEFYLTDILEHANREGQRVTGMLLKDSQELLGVNTLFDLSIINKALRMKKINELIEKGVRFDLPESVVIESSVEIASGARIGPNVQIYGKSTISEGVHVEGTAYIQDSIIGSNSHIKLGVRMENAVIGASCSVGPFANLRPKSNLEDEVRIGNFVETKAAHLAKGAKANHLTYLGDCSVGKNSNIGAGTITCNYDGYAKYKTTIEDDVFIGSNTSLVAPVKIEQGATVGAGSVITKDVEKDSLAFSRAPQVIKSAWSKKRRESKAKAAK